MRTDPHWLEQARAGSVRRFARVLVILTGGAALMAGCSVGAPPRDREAEAALAHLTSVLEGELAGRSVAGRSELTALVRAAYPAVADTGAGSLRYATYQGRAQDLPDDTALAVAVWERRTGPDPFTDDIPRWHLLCAELGIDRAGASLRAVHVRCPGSTPQEPPDAEGSHESAPQLDLAAPGEAGLMRGEPAVMGEAAGHRRRARPATANHPCGEGELAAVLEGLTTAGAADDATVRVLNTSSLACRLGGRMTMTVQRNGQAGATGTTMGATVVLAPMESVAVPVSWRPVQSAQRHHSQQTRLTVDSVEVPVRLGAGLPDSPIAALGSSSIAVGEWGRPGYGRDPDDDHGDVDIAPPCDPVALAVEPEPAPAPVPGSSGEPGSSGGPGPAPLALINVGVTACRLEPTRTQQLGSLLDVLDVDDLSLARLTVLAPGAQVRVTPSSDPMVRAGHLLVGGSWQPVAG